MDFVKELIVGSKNGKPKTKFEINKILTFWVMLTTHSNDRPAITGQFGKKLIFRQPQKKQNNNNNSVRLQLRMRK